MKVMHETGIPYGSYLLVMSYSNRFKKYLPELLDVPGFAGIRIHPGNSVEDTSGCPLPGVKQNNKVINSKVSYSKLEKLILAVIKKEKIFVTVKPPQQPETHSSQVV